MALFKLKRRQLLNILLFLQILCTLQSGTQIDTRWEHCLRKQIKWESTNNFSVFVPYLDLQIKKLDLTRDEKNKKVWAFCLTRFSKLGVQNPRNRTDKVTFSKEEEKHFLKRRNRKRKRKRKARAFLICVRELLCQCSLRNFINVRRLDLILNINFLVNALFGVSNSKIALTFRAYSR